MPKISAEFVVTRDGLPLRSRLRAVADSPATVTFQGDAATKLTLSGTFLPPAADIDLLTDHVCPYLIIDGRRLPMGEYVMTTLPLDRTGDDRQISATCYDLSYLCRLHKVEARPFWPAGTPYTAIFQQILMTCGLRKMDITESGEVLATDREDWEPGTEWLDVVNDLAAEINYRSLTMDLEGRAVLAPYAPPGADRVRHRYKADGTSLLAPEMTIQEDLFDVPNVFIVLCENPDYDAPLRAEAVNDDLADPGSVPNRGRVPLVETVDNIAGPKALQAYADNLRLKSRIGQRTLEFSVGFDALDAPRRPFDMTELTLPDAHYLVEETGWTATLGHTGGWQVTGSEVVYH